MALRCVVVRNLASNCNEWFILRQRWRWRKKGLEKGRKKLYPKRRDNNKSEDGGKEMVSGIIGLGLAVIVYFVNFTKGSVIGT